MKPRHTDTDTYIQQQQQQQNRKNRELEERVKYIAIKKRVIKSDETNRVTDS